MSQHSLPYIATFPDLGMERINKMTLVVPYHSKALGQLDLSAVGLGLLLSC